MCRLKGVYSCWDQRSGWRFDSRLVLATNLSWIIGESMFSSMSRLHGPRACPPVFFWETEDLLRQVTGRTEWLLRSM